MRFCPPRDRVSSPAPTTHGLSAQLFAGRIAHVAASTDDCLPSRSQRFMLATPAASNRQVAGVKRHVHDPPFLLPLRGMLLHIRGSTSTQILVCISPKGGSTSLLAWLAARFTNRTDASIHAPRALLSRVAGPFSVHAIGGVAAQQAALELPLRRFAVVRHPLERALSAYYSKISCHVGDGRTKAAFISQLAAAAPKASATAACLRYNDTQPRRHGDGLNTPCLRAYDWARMLMEAPVHKTDPHFLPQTKTCGLGSVSYDRLIPLESPEQGLRELSALLRVPYAALPRRHRTRRREPVMPATRPMLEAVYAADLRLLPFYDREKDNSSWSGRSFTSRPVANGLKRSHHVGVGHACVS